jgi:hypothetical protein
VRFTGNREEPIEEYLDELLSRLRLPPRATRRLLAEAEDHLREDAANAERAGSGRLEAERAAVARFGSAARIATEERRVRRPNPIAAVGTIAWAGVVLVGVGLTAVGLSGVLAAVFNGLAGTRFVGALPQNYSPAFCAHVLALHAGAGTCSIAAILENSHDAVALRLLAGLVGLVLLVIAMFTRRYLNTDPSFRHLLAATINATAALAFGAAAAGLVTMSINTAVHYGSGGVGWYLSGAIVSVIAAVAAALGTWRHLRVLRPWNHALTPAQG